MKRVIVFVFLVNILSGQKNNVFMSYSEFQKNQPSEYIDAQFELKHRTQGDILMTGGIMNYRLKKIKPKSEKEKLTKKVWGIIYNDTIYMNSYPFSSLLGYNKIEGKGFYTYFIGQTALLKKDQINVGIIKENEKRMNVCCGSGYVIFPDGKVKILKPELMEILLKDQDELLQEFKSKDLKQENVYEMFDFLNRYNQVKGF